jgi:hypothetical protein
MRKINAIRYIPASFNPYQGRTDDKDELTIAIAKNTFKLFREYREALLHPWAWVVLSVPTEVRCLRFPYRYS